MTRKQMRSHERARHHPAQPGTCRICGCTKYTRCRYLPRPGVPLGNQPVMTCEWADKTKTLCGNPACLEKAKEVEGE